MEGKAYEFGLLRADLSKDDYNKLLCKEGELHVIGQLDISPCTLYCQWKQWLYHY